MDILSFLAILYVCALSLNPKHSETAELQRATALAAFLRTLRVLPERATLAASAWVETAKAIVAREWWKGE